MRAAFILTLALLGLTLSVSSNAQAGSTDFSTLRSDRAKVVLEIDSLKVNLRELDGQLRVIDINPVGIRKYIDQVSAEIKQMEVRVETLRKTAGAEEKVASIEQQITLQKSSLERAIRDVDERNKITLALADVTSKLRTAESQLVTVETRISELLARDVVAQQFKGNISLYFAVVIGLMVILFFGVIFYDENVRTIVFGSQAAIQFVTLFSIIIAIILFGITGILADKELAALLGGLSGYILGKYNETPVRQSTPIPSKGKEIVDKKESTDITASGA